MPLRNLKYVASSIALILLALSVLACNKTEPGPEGESEPRPDLTPEQVVKLQLEAIRDSEGTDTGLAAAYRLASPDHKRRVGTLTQFAGMIRSAKFQAMLGFQAAEFGLTRIEGNRARQIVTLKDKQGRIQMFLFELQRQQSGPDKGCWLTEAVHPSEMNLIQSAGYSDNQS